MISVCIATYNGGKYIIRQVNSILTQIRPNDEVIVSDDNSTDNTLELLESLKDNRIKVVVNNTNINGPLANFENALKLAKGDFIFLSDQDDIWLPDKVDVLLESLKTHDLVLSDCEVVDNKIITLIPSFFGFRGSRPGFWRNLYKNSYMGCCMAFRREILTYVLPIPNIVHMHDWWIGLLVELYGDVLFVHKPLIKYIRHGDNASPTSELSAHSFWERLTNRLTIVLYIFKRWLR